VTQLAVRYTAAFFVGVVGWDAAKSDSFIALAVEAGVAAALFGIDLLIRNARRKAGLAK
jgi:hypothetical protein